MRKNAWTLVGMIAAGALAGCGGSDGFSTPVPGAATVEDLPPLQFAQLCDEVNSYLTQQIDTPRLCEVGAVIETASQASQDPSLTDARLQQSCEALTPQICASLASAAAAMETVGNGLTVCTLGVACTATVSQLSACLNDTETALGALEQMVPPCATISRATLASLNPGSLFVQPESCKPLDASCPVAARQTDLASGQSPASATSQ